MVTKKNTIRKRLLAAVLTLAMVASLMPAAFAEGEDISLPKEGEGDPTVPATSVSISVDKNILKVGETATITYTTTPGGLTPSFSITDGEGNISISGTTVKAERVGSATITATVPGTNDSSVTDSCSITVESSEIPVEHIYIQKTSLDLTVGETVTLTARVEPANASEKGYTWESDNPSIASCDNMGTVRGISPGTANITVVSDADKTIFDKCTVTVTDLEVESVRIDAHKSTMAVGDSQLFTATVLPDKLSSSKKAVSWSSTSDTVKVTPDGTVTALSPGSAIILVTSVDNPKKSDSCEITVTDKKLVTGITMSPTSASIAVNGTQQLTATVEPSDATDKGLTWKSSNTNIATVSTSGLVTGKAAGTATITATANDNSGKSATCTITVTSAAFTLNQTSLNLFPQQQYTLTASNIPTGATIKWTTCNSNVKLTANNTVSNGSSTCTVAANTTSTSATADVKATVTVNGTTQEKVCRSRCAPPLP